MRRFEVRGPAKVNLDLRVLGLRADGFHEVRTILQTLALHDTLTVTVRPGPLTVRSRAPWMPRDRDNLVWTAGAALWRALGRSGPPAGAAVAIRKRIPAGAGLGGASSDAAAVLRALHRVWAPAARARLLHEVAAAVGSDVAFFLRGGTMLATGRGERTRALPALRPYVVVLASPPFAVSTPAAYRWWDAMGGRTGRGGPADRSSRTGGDGASGGRAPAGWRADPGRLRNHLEDPVVARRPEIGEVASRLRAAGAWRAAMTGSGSAVFGLFESTAAGVRARRAIRRPGWRTVLTRTVDAAACARLAAVARID